MNIAVTFHRAARAEFIESAAWYENQRRNLGVEFIAEIERCVAVAASQPFIHAVVHGDVRRVNAKRFPYSVYFQAEKHRIVVLAVFHSSRDPAMWQQRT